MADSSKKVSELPLTSNVSTDDRILVLYNANNIATQSVRTITVSNFLNDTNISNTSLIYANIASAYTNSIFDSSIDAGNKADAAYANAMAYSDGVSATAYANATTFAVSQSYVNTSQLDANLANFASYSTSIPANTSSAGITGTLAYDATYLYICIATNNWVRVPTQVF